MVSPNERANSLAATGVAALMQINEATDVPVHLQNLFSQAKKDPAKSRVNNRD